MSSGRSSELFSLEALRLSCSGCSLQELCLPATLRGDDLAKLSDMVGHERYARRAHIYNTGDRCDSLYVVHGGSVKTWMTSLNGHVQVLGFHLPGEIFGLDGVSEHHYHCTAESLEPVEVCRLPYAELEKVANEVPGLQKQLMRMVSREFMLDNEHLTMMGARPAMERLALFLQTLSQRRALLGLERDIVEMSMSRIDVANYLALATETVSRLLSRLQDLEVIRLDRRWIKILDMDRLIEISGEDLGLIHYPD